MSVNVLGGSLEFDAVLTTDGLDAGSAAIEAEIQKLIASYQKLSTAGDNIGDGFQNASEQAKLFGALMLHVSQQTGQAFDAKEVKKYADAIDIANQAIAPLVTTLAEKVGADKINELGDALEKVDDDGKALKLTLQFIKDNIGALQLDPTGAQALNNAIQQLEKTFFGLNEQADSFIQKEDRLGTSTPTLGSSSGSSDTKSSPDGTEKQLSAMQQLTKLRKQLASMDESDPLFKSTFDQAVKLQGSIENINKSLKSAGNSTSAFQGLAGIIRGLIGGFEAWNGVLGLTATQSEEVQQTITKVVSAMGILNGIEEIAAILDKNSAANLFLTNLLRKESAIAAGQQATATEALVLAQEADAVAAGEAAVATEALNVAMAANPAGILLVALTGIVLVLQAIASGQKDATEEQIKSNEALAQAIELYNKLADLRGELNRLAVLDANNAVSLAQAQGKSELEILDLKKKALVVEQAANITALARLNYDKESFDALNAQLESLLQEEAVLKKHESLYGELNDFQKERLKLLEAQIKPLQAQVVPLTQLVEESKKLDAARAANQAETDKKIFDNQLKSASANADAILLLAKKNTEEELRDRIEAIQKATIVELNNANLTSGERKKILAKEQADITAANRAYQALLLKDAVDVAQSRVTAAQKGTQLELDAQLDLIHAIASEQLLTGDKLAGEKKKIREEEIAAELEIERRRSLLILSNQKEALQAQLALATQGSQQELDLKLRLLDNEANAELITAGANADKIAHINADLIKQQAELRKKYALDASQVEVETIISGINTRLAAVEKGSKDELELKRQLVEEEARLDIIQAEGRIHNENQLVAKILEINTTANEKKKKLEGAYYDGILQQQIKIIETQREIENVSLDNIINNPFSTQLQVYYAQRQKLTAELDDTKKELDLVHNDISLRRGDAETLNKRLEDLRQKANKLKREVADFEAKEPEAIRQQLIRDFSDIGSSLQNLGSAIQGIDENAAHGIETMAKFASAASKALSSAASFSAGDIVGGIVGGLGAVSDFISGIFGGGTPSITKEQIQQLQDQVLTGEIEITQQYQQRLVDQAKLNKLRIEGIEAETRALQQQAKTTQQQFNDLLAEIQKLQGQKLVHIDLGPLQQDFLATFSLSGLSFDQLNELFLKGQLSDRAKELFQELQKLKDAGADIDKALADAKDQLDQTFTGTTSDDITDSIVDGFKNGLHSAADFASTFQDLMRNAILNALKYQVLQGPLQQFYDQFAINAESDSVLTQGEVEDLQKKFDDIINNANQKFQELQQITNINFSSAAGSGNTLAGAIKGITEQQAELLAGQFGGLRVTAIEQLNIATRNLQVLQQIEANTAGISDVKAILRRLELNGVKIQ